MLISFPLFLTIYAGFTHAFEADHLLAVSNIVSGRNNIRSSIKDGAFWGLGHAATIFLTGILMIIFKAAIKDSYFHYFEAAVGMVLIALAVCRLAKLFRNNTVLVHAHGHDHEHGGIRHDNLHINIGNPAEHRHAHKLAFGVGLVHGLAGSGALIIVVMSQIKAPIEGMIYLMIFGASCIGGMMLAAGLFSIPFSKKIIAGRALRPALTIVSCGLCLLYGGKVIYQNLIA